MPFGSQFLTGGSRCPSIQQKDGIRNLAYYLEKSQFPRESVNAICKLTESVLSKNVFEFNNELYVQTLGTAIGTKLTPSYANIFLAVLEQEFLTKSL